MRNITDELRALVDEAKESQGAQAKAQKTAQAGNRRAKAAQATADTIDAPTLMDQIIQEYASQGYPSPEEGVMVGPPSLDEFTGPPALHGDPGFVSQTDPEKPSWLPGDSLALKGNPGTRVGEKIPEWWKAFIKSAGSGAKKLTEIGGD